MDPDHGQMGHELGIAARDIAHGKEQDADDGHEELAGKRGQNRALRKQAKGNADEDAGKGEKHGGSLAVA